MFGSLCAELKPGQELEHLNYKGEKLTKIQIRKITPAFISVMHSYGGGNLFIHLLDKKFIETHFPNFDIDKARAWYKNYKVKSRSADAKASKTIAQKRLHEKLAIQYEEELKKIQIKIHDTGLKTHEQSSSGITYKLKKPIPFNIHYTIIQVIPGEGVLCRHKFKSRNSFIVCDTEGLRDGLYVPGKIGWKIGTYTYNSLAGLATIEKLTTVKKVAIDYLKSK